MIFPENSDSNIDRPVGDFDGFDDLDDGQIIVLGDDLSIVPLASGDPGRSDRGNEQRSMLVVEDDDVDAELLTRLVQRLPGQEWTLHRAKTLAAALELMRSNEPQVALVDLNLPDAWHTDIVQALVECAPDCAIIVQTGSNDAKAPVEMLKTGAQDYLHKGSITVDSLGRAIRHSLARHQTLAALRRTWTRLAKANAELDDFAHIVAHDLRAPTRTARMLSDRLVAEVKESSGPLAVDLGERLDETLGRMDAMILSILEYAGLRHDVGTNSTVCLVDLISDVQKSMAADLLDFDVTVQLQIPSDLSVAVDHELMARAVLNIMGNSVKYRHPDAKARIIVAADRVGDDVIIRFRDNGIGIAKADRERVFGLLERLHKVHVEGLGFGLAICRRIIEGFGGKIWIEPNDPSGTTVVIQVPASHPEIIVLQEPTIHLD